MTIRKSEVAKEKKAVAASRQRENEDPKALKVIVSSTETQAEALAHTSLRPTAQAALTLLDYNKGFGEMSINTLVDDLGRQCELASGGDLRRSEAMLTAQAHTLDAIFHTLARRAQKVKYLSQFDTYMRLALRAQSQCRATTEALANMKNPRPLAYVQQANIGQAVQVNNGAAGARIGNAPNELLEEKHGSEWLDAGTAATASQGNTSVETVEAVNRAK